MPPNSNIINTITKLHIQATQEGLFLLYCNECSFRLVTHSNISIITTIIIVFFEPTYIKGALKILTLNTPQTYSQAIPILSALKIIHPSQPKRTSKASVQFPSKSAKAALRPLGWCTCGSCPSISKAGTKWRGTRPRR